MHEEPVDLVRLFASAFVNLYTADIEAALRFYRDLLPSAIEEDGQPQGHSGARAFTRHSERAPVPACTSAVAFRNAELSPELLDLWAKPLVSLALFGRGASELGHPYLRGCD
jgi:catechol 2,3-dioxygenase-like lactoylglutathione lyase family enzyme